VVIHSYEYGTLFSEGINPLEVCCTSPVSIPTNCLYSFHLHYLQIISFAYYLILSKPSAVL
jgi:hypothetical protein